MTVLVGEGTIEIIYGSISIPAGAQTLGGYLARPDGEGDWPTVLVFGPEPSPPSSVKNMCRVFARHGIAMLAPDLTRDYEVNGVIASQVGRFVAAAKDDWSNAHLGYGVLGFGHGIYDTARLAARDESVAAEASVAATLDETVAADLSRAEVPGLWIGSRLDPSVDVDLSVDRSDTLSRTMFVVYPDAAEGFWNDDADGFDTKAATDTVDRLIAFFGRELPQRI